MTARTHDPDPETPEKTKRRNFNAAYKRKILGQIDTGLAKPQRSLAGIAEYMA